MKKITMLAISTFIVCSSYSQTKYAGCIIEQTTEGATEMIWKNDSMQFTFKPTDLFWKATIENKTKSNATIHWDQVSFIRNKKASKIVFDNTSRINMNDPLPDLPLPSGSEVSKEIFPVELWWTSGPYPVYKKKSLKKEGDMIVRIILPITIGENKKDYEFSFLIIPS